MQSVQRIETAGSIASQDAFRTAPARSVSLLLGRCLLGVWLLLQVAAAEAAAPECVMTGQALPALNVCMRLLPHDAEEPAFISDTMPLADKASGQSGQWVEIAVRNAHEYEVKRLLAFGIPDAYFLQLFQIRGGRAVMMLNMDRPLAFAERPVPNRFLYADVTLAAKQDNVFYVYYRTHGKTPLYPRLLTEAELARRDTRNDLANGAIFGILGFLIPVVFITQQGRRDAAAYAYAALIVGCMLFLGQIEGYNFQFLWPAWPLWNRQAPNFIGLVSLLSHAAFTLLFLQVRQRFKRLYFLLTGIMVLAFCTLLVPQGRYGVEWVVALSAAYSIIAVGTGFWAAHRQVPAARFYLLGALSLVVFSVLMIILTLVWRNPFPQWSMFVYPKIAYVLEPLFFIVAMTIQLRRFNEQKAALRVKRQAETELLIKAEQDRLAALRDVQNQQLLLAAAGHDLTQPLASLRFALDALRARDDRSPIAQHIDKTLDHAQALIQDMILQARRQTENRADRVPLWELFEQLQDEFSASAAKKGLGLSFVPSNIDVHGSGLMLHRILGNLLANAVRYTRKGRIVFGVRRRSGYIEIQVHDTGIGLLESDRQALKAAFRQGGTVDHGGYGLGLFSVNTLCRQCGYDLLVSSTLNKGSVFSIKIPLQEHA